MLPFIMKAVKKYFGKNGDNPVMHFVLSYDISTTTDERTACIYTERIAHYFSDQYQLVTAVHREYQNNSLYHAHIVMNPVNINNGKLYHSGYSELHEFAKHIYKVTGNYCKPRINKN